MFLSSLCLLPLAVYHSLFLLFIIFIHVSRGAAVALLPDGVTQCYRGLGATRCLYLKRNDGSNDWLAAHNIRLSLLSACTSACHGDGAEKACSYHAAVYSSGSVWRNSAGAPISQQPRSKRKRHGGGVMAAGAAAAYRLRRLQRWRLGSDALRTVLLFVTLVLVRCDAGKYRYSSLYADKKPLRSGWRRWRLAGRRAVEHPYRQQTAPGAAIPSPLFAAKLCFITSLSKILWRFVWLLRRRLFRLLDGEHLRSAFPSALTGATA
jgi:hypothetical protein